MKDTNMIQKQRGLIDQFWKRGWACFRCDAMSTSYADNQYIVAMKNSSIAILNIQQLNSGNSKKNVVEESNEMMTIASIVEPSAMMAQYDVTVGFAVTKGWSEVWRFADYRENSLRYKDSYSPLWEEVRG